MHDAIYAQPGALRLVMRGQGEVLAEGRAGLAAALARVADGRRHLVARRACRRTACWPRSVGSAPASAPSTPSNFSHYGPAAASGEGCVVISHRGHSPSGPAALARARAAGGVTVASRARAGDGLAAAEYVLRTVDQEASGCHTVSYTTALAMLASLAAAIGHDDELGHQLDAPSGSARLPARSGGVGEPGRALRRAPALLVRGRRPNVATAYEAALKLSEAAWVSAIGLECEQFLHGPWAALEPDDVVFVIAPPGPRTPAVATWPGRGRHRRHRGGARGRGRPRDRRPGGRDHRVAGGTGAALADHRDGAAAALDLITSPVRAGANPDTVREETPTAVPGPR